MKIMSITFMLTTSTANRGIGNRMSIVKATLLNFHQGHFIMPNHSDRGHLQQRAKKHSNAKWPVFMVLSAESLFWKCIDVNLSQINCSLFGTDTKPVNIRVSDYPDRMGSIGTGLTWFLAPSCK